DACTNMATCVQTISVVDSAPPSITCPTNITVQCGGDTSPAAAGMATASDNCGNVTITFNDSEPAACGKVITRTWTATDACGNTAMCAQTVTVVDATPPRLMVFYPQNHASLQTDGFRFFLIAPTNVSYVIERSTNLTDWTEFQTLQLITNQTLIGDSGASSVPWRFYRARRVQ
ncbi:MAG: HYR domain-containing protein, partial [Verrucomicrobia subdivision 3 bacterium]|nr:HYR domain-containing protein [Limisphaerales bacterium]